MVFFTCDSCNEALKKTQVISHKCRHSTFSCLDCGVAFTKETYKDHLKCLSEDKKYGGKNYVEKENKGEAKQNRWVEDVEEAIAKVQDPLLRKLLERLRGYGNIPRTERKFINFLSNSLRIRDKDLSAQAWRCIKEVTESVNEVGDAEEAKSDKQKPNESKVDTSMDAEMLENAGEETASQQGKKGEKSFKWKRAIKRTLKETDTKQMKLKKLRKIVIEKCLESCGDRYSTDEMISVFERKLESMGLIIDGKTVSLA